MKEVRNSIWRFRDKGGGKSHGRSRGKKKASSTLFMGAVTLVGKNALASVMRMDSGGKEKNGGCSDGSQVSIVQGEE